MNETASALVVIERVSGIFGPVGALALVLACVMGWFYRRDVLHEVEEARELARRDAIRQERLMDLLERHARSDDGVAAALDRLARTIQELEHSHNNILSGILRRLEADRDRDR